jgi:hypothetical protein
MVAFLRTRLSGRPTDQREHVITVVPRTNRKEVTRVAGLPAQPASAVRAAMRFVPLACPLPGDSRGSRAVADTSSLCAPTVCQLTQRDGPDLFTAVLLTSSARVTN